MYCLINHISVENIFLAPLRNRKNKEVRKYAIKNQQAALEQVKRVLTTRFSNYARKKSHLFYEKENSGGNLAWIMFNNFMIAKVCESIVLLRFPRPMPLNTLLVVGIHMF